MNIRNFSNYDILSQRANELVVEEIRSKKDLLLCAATGGSPEGLYRELVTTGAFEPELLSSIRVIKLDEWGGIPPGSPGTCEAYLQERLLEPLGISGIRYISFNSLPDDPDLECQRIQAELDLMGPIDLCILGLGRNGHLGLNEPGPELQSHCHVASLTQSSMGHAMTARMEKVPEYGLTLGMSDILSSLKILLIISGEGKEEAKNMFLSGKITTHCPASYLWMHPDVDCLVLE